jgi:hypothetical protein
MAKFKDNMKEKWSRFKKRVGKIFKRDPGIQEITDISLPPQDPPPRPARPRDSQIPAERKFSAPLFISFFEAS